MVHCFDAVGLTIERASGLCYARNLQFVRLGPTRHGLQELLKWPDEQRLTVVAAAAAAAVVSE